MTEEEAKGLEHHFGEGQRAAGEYVKGWNGIDWLPLGDGSIRVYATDLTVDSLTKEEWERLTRPIVMPADIPPPVRVHKSGEWMQTKEWLPVDGLEVLFVTRINGEWAICMGEYDADKGRFTSVLEHRHGYFEAQQVLLWQPLPLLPALLWDNEG